MPIDYDNKELLEHTMMAIRAFGFSGIDSVSHNTELGEILFELESMPGKTIQLYDEEGNHIASDLAFLIKAKTPQFTISFRVSADAWYSNDKPPKVGGERT